MKTLLALLLLSSGWTHNGHLGLRGSKAGLTSTLRPLQCNDTCELHLVADDYVAAAATWTARVGGNATKADTIVKAASATFTNRSSVDTTNGCFLTASGTDNITSTSTKTYEVVVDNYGSTGSEYILCRRDGSNAQIANWIYKNTGTTSIESIIYNAAVAGYLGASPIITADFSNKPVLFTLTIDVAATTMILYANGVAVNTDTSASGVLNSNVAVGLGIGCRNTAGAREGAFTGKIMEVLRHNSVLSATTIAARAAQFNALKGY